MPNLADKYEAILSDLDALEEIVKSPAFPSLPTPTEVAAMGRVILSVRPLLDTIVELGAELEVALVQNAQIEPLEKERDELRVALRSLLLDGYVDCIVEPPCGKCVPCNARKLAEVQS